MQQLLDELKQVAASEGFQATMYGVSKLTGIPTSTLSRWQRKQVRPSSDQCALIALHLGKDIGEVEMQVALSFVKDAKVRKVWETLAGKAAATAASLICLIFLPSGGVSSHIERSNRLSQIWSMPTNVQNYANLSSSTHAAHFILCQLLLLLAAALTTRRKRSALAQPRYLCGVVPVCTTA